MNTKRMEYLLCSSNMQSFYSETGGHFRHVPLFMEPEDLLLGPQRREIGPCILSYSRIHSTMFTVHGAGNVS